MENVSDVLLTDDQNFLLYFIIGAFFGPDLKEGKPQKSALQRLVQGLPQYHADDLAGSHMPTKVIKNVYYYLVRKAEQSVVVNRPLILQYIHGTLPLPLKGRAANLQFDDLFPLTLHQRSQYENQHCTIDSIVFIDNPDMDYMRPGDVERFKRLTGLEYFVLDREMQWIVVDDGALFDAKLRETSRLDVTMPHLDVKLLDYVPSNSAMPFSSSTFNESQISHGSIVPSQMTTSTGENIDQGVIYFPSCPSKEEWSNLVATIKRGFALTGSAASGHVGPVLGLMDIGESEDSYLFRVSLPGVRRDERDFSCEVESDGTVIIKGVTVTGERAVEKFSQVFVMRSQNLCPPGPFSISFKLPGPVDPQQFLGTFGTDGIFEGIAWKAMRYRT